MIEKKLNNFFLGMVVILLFVLLGMIAYAIWDHAGLMGFVAIIVFLVASKVVGDFIMARFNHD